MPDELVPESNQNILNNWKKLLTWDGLPLLFQFAVAISTLSYIFGYLSWARYASDNDLGYLPAIREQYFIAGIVPTVLLGITLVIARANLMLSTWLRSWLFARRLQGSKYIFYIFIFSSLFFIISVFQANHYFWLFSITLPCYILVLYITYHSSENISMALAMSRFVFPIIILLLACLIYNLYSVKFFPIMPRGLGGPAPMFVSMDVKRDELSPSTISLLKPHKEPGDTNKVIRTAPLYLIFDEGDFVLLKQRDTAIGKNNTLIKLKRDLIHGLFNVF